MATFKGGPFGSFSGKIGTVVGAKWRKLNVARSVPSKSSKAATETQLSQRAKFALVTKFLSPVRDSINLGYQHPASNLSPMNAAVKYHLENAVTGVYPDFKIDYTRVLLSKGRSAMENSANATVLPGSKFIDIKWDNPLFESKQTLPTDVAQIVLYVPSVQRYRVFNEGTVRSAKGLKMEVSSAFVGQKVHCWLFFASADQKLVSECNYIGEVTVL